MLRTMVSMLAIAFAVAVWCESADAQAGGGPGAPVAKPATQPAGGMGEFVENKVIVIGGPDGVTVKSAPQPGGVSVKAGGHDFVIREGAENEGKASSTNPPGYSGPSPWGPYMPGAQFWQPMKLEKAAYLGLSAVPVGEDLASQLSLAKGVGLIVEMVGEDSPAKTAGVEKFDVLTKLDDQIIINPPQLQVLVRTHKAGDEIKLTVIRKAKEQVITVKLIEKELPPLQPFFGGLEGARFGEERERMLEMPVRNEIRVGPGGAGFGYGPWVKGPPELGTSSVVFTDKDQTFTMKTVDGKKTLTVVDVKSGKTLFTGPIDTPEQRKAVPADYLKRWEDLEKKIQFTPGGAMGGNPKAPEPRTPAPKAPAVPPPPRDDD